MPWLDKRERERGGALLVALALLALAAALLAGSAQAGRAMARSAQSFRASIAVEAEARAAVAEFVGAWASANDSLRVGGSAESALAPRPLGTAGLVAVSRFRLVRVSASRYIVGVETSVGPPGQSSARRRLSLILERGPVSDTSVVKPAPIPIGQWSLADLF